jgi:hypothetical protein
VEKAPERVPEKTPGAIWDLLRAGSWAKKVPGTLLWTGSWEDGGNVANRGDLKLSLAKPGVTLRAEVLDRRPGDVLSLPDTFSGEATAAYTHILGGLYHPATGSRILYGALEEWGLATRLRSPWGRGLPFAESRKATMADLRTSFSSKESELYIYLGTPTFKLPQPLQWRGFTAIRTNPAAPEDMLTVGLEARLDKMAALSLEGIHSARELPAQKASAWFSETPPLPARGFEFYGLGMLLSVPYLSLSTDWAWSQTAINGGNDSGDLYANLGLRVGNIAGLAGPAKKALPRWQLSLAADGAGPRYIGSDGASPGAGFRTGGKFEWQQERIGFFRLSTSLSGPGISPDLFTDFNRSSSGIYYRPPAATLPLRVSRISLTANRDAREPVTDSLGLNLSMAAHPKRIITGLFAGNIPGFTGNALQEGSLALSLSGSLTGSPTAEEKSGEEIPPWPIPRGPYRFESAKAGGQLSWSGPINLSPFGGGSAGGSGPQQNLQIKAGLDYTAKATGFNASENAKLEDLISETWDLSLSATLRGRRGRFAVKILYPDFPLFPREGENTELLRDAWKLTLSWGMEWR